MAEAFRDNVGTSRAADEPGFAFQRGEQRTLFHGQRVPLRAGGLRSILAARSRAVGRRISADARGRMGFLQERITSTTKGSITSVQAIYVPADDLTDPAPATTFSHLDSTIVLSRQLASLGIYPAIDPLDSARPRSRLRSSAKNTTAWPTRRAAYCNVTKTFRTSSPFSVSKSFPTRIKTRLPRPQDTAFSLAAIRGRWTFTEPRVNMSHSRIRYVASLRILDGKRCTK